MPKKENEIKTFTFMKNSHASFLILSTLIIFSHFSYAGHGLRKVNSQEYEKAQKKARDQSRDEKYRSVFPATVEPSEIEVADDEAERALYRMQHMEEFEDWHYSATQYYSGIALRRLAEYRAQMEVLTAQLLLKEVCVEGVRTLEARVEEKGWSLDLALAISIYSEELHAFDRDFKNLSRDYGRVKSFLHKHSDHLTEEVYKQRLKKKDFQAFKKIQKVWEYTRRFKKQTKGFKKADDIIKHEQINFTKVMDDGLNLSVETLHLFNGSENRSSEN